MGFNFKVSDYEKFPLFQYSRDYFPIIITIEGSEGEDY
jgi:hypothetical protein